MRNSNKNYQKWENELLESTAIIHGVHEENWEDGTTRYNMVVDVLAYTMYGTSHHEQLTSARKILIKKTSRLGKYNPNRGETNISNIRLQ